MHNDAAFAADPSRAADARAELGLSILLLAAWSALTIWLQWGHWAEDLSAIYIAAHLWQTGQADLIYAAPPGFFGGAAPEWQPVLDGLGIGDRITFPYVYPPLWAALLAPLTEAAGPQAFADAVTLVQVPLLAASVLLAGRLVRPAAFPFWLWSLVGLLILTASLQSYIALWHNQPTITVTFLVLLAFVCLAEGRPVAAGAALALAAAIKLTPAAFALIFLVDRQYRAIAAFALVGGALGLLSLALAGPDLHLVFLDSLGAIRESVLLNAVNVSLLPALMSAGSALGFLPPFDAEAHLVVLRPVPPGLGLALSLAALALAGILAAGLRRQPGPLRRVIGLFALSIVLALFGPLGWLHYYLLPLLLLPGLFGLCSQRTAMLLCLAVALPSLRVTFAQIDLLPWPVANYLWIACAAWLAVLAALLLGLRRAS